MLTASCLSFPVDTSLKPSRGHSGEALILPKARDGDKIIRQPGSRGKRNVLQEKKKNLGK